MKKLWLIFFVVLGLVGCRKAGSPDLRVEKNTLDSMQVVKDLGSNAKIVTGVPAIVEDKHDLAAEDPKDKPGAVALKMEY